MHDARCGVLHEEARGRHPLLVLYVGVPQTCNRYVRSVMSGTWYPWYPGLVQGIPGTWYTGNLVPGTWYMFM